MEAIDRLELLEKRINQVDLPSLDSRITFLQSNLHELR